MNLKEYNKDNSWRSHIRVSVSLNYKSGLILFSSGLMRSLALGVGHRVALLQDKDIPTDWYIGLKPEGFKIRNVGGKQNAYGFSCKKACRDLLSSLGKNSKHVFQVSLAPVDGLYSIITAGELQK